MVEVNVDDGKDVMKDKATLSQKKLGFVFNLLDVFLVRFARLI